MKKLATVDIYEMEPQEQQGHGGITDQYSGDDTHWRIRLASREKYKGDVLNGANPSVLAHELGHVVAHIFALPEALKDDAAMDIAEKMFGSSKAVSMSKDAMKLKLAAEKQAWGIAHEEGVQINPENEKRSIASYEQAVEDAPL